MTPPRTEASSPPSPPGDTAGPISGVVRPNAIDVTWRAAAIWTTWMKARFGVSETLQEVCDDLRVQKYLTEYEERYLRDRGSDTAADTAYRCRMHRVWTLFWSIGLIPNLNARDSGAEVEMRSLIEGRSAEDLVYEARLRPLGEIIGEAEHRGIDFHLSDLGRIYAPDHTRESAQKAAGGTIGPAIRVPNDIEPCIAIAWILGRFSADNCPEPAGIR